MELRVISTQHELLCGDGLFTQRWHGWLQCRRWLGGERRIRHHETVFPWWENTKPSAGGSRKPTNYAEYILHHFGFISYVFSIPVDHLSTEPTARVRSRKQQCSGPITAELPADDT